MGKCKNIQLAPLWHVFNIMIMRILIIGPLGAGKSSLAYAVSKKFDLPRLNLDEICRNPADGSYYSRDEQLAKLKAFITEHPSWVAEGCQKDLYEILSPDLVVDMRVHPAIFIPRFTICFLKAKKLVGQDVAKDLPVQAYHYRKITPRKIWQYTMAGMQINAEIKRFLQRNRAPSITCRAYRDYPKVFQVIENMKQQA